MADEDDSIEIKFESESVSETEAVKELAIAGVRHLLTHLDPDDPEYDVIDDFAHDVIKTIQSIKPLYNDNPADEKDEIEQEED